MLLGALGGVQVVRDISDKGFEFYSSTIPDQYCTVQYSALNRTSFSYRARVSLDTAFKLYSIVLYYSVSY